MFELFVTRQISIRQSNSVQTDLSISSSTLATAVVMSRKNAWKQIFIFPLRYENCVNYAYGVDNVESVYLFYSNPVPYNNNQFVISCAVRTAEVIFRQQLATFT
jgi:hypothetical protein